MSDIKDYRSDYGKQTLNRKDLPQDPIELFQSWLQEASRIQLKKMPMLYTFYGCF